MIRASSCRRKRNRARFFIIAGSRINHSVFVYSDSSFYGIRSYFGELLGLNDNFAHSKVDRAKDYIARNGFDQDKVLFIGDTDHDYEAASAVGCPCVLMTGGHQGRAVLERCGVPVFDTFDELKAYLAL